MTIMGCSMLYSHRRSVIKQEEGTSFMLMVSIPLFFVFYFVLFLFNSEVDGEMTVLSYLMLIRVSDHSGYKE